MKELYTWARSRNYLKTVLKTDICHLKVDTFFRIKIQNFQKGQIFFFFLYFSFSIKTLSSMHMLQNSAVSGRTTRDVACWASVLQSLLHSVTQAYHSLVGWSWVSSFLSQSFISKSILVIVVWRIVIKKGKKSTPYSKL